MNSSTLIKFPVLSFRKVASPYDEAGKHAYVAVTNIKDLPEELEDWREINPRDPKLTSGVSKKIEATLRDDPASFLFKNRGITLMVDKTRFDNQTNTLEIELTDKERNGLLDGGHTFRVIQSFLESADDTQSQDVDVYLRIEILEGFNELDEAVGIVESRNTSTQVKEQSLEELLQHYERIKEVLSEQEYADRIAYKEYELLEDGSPKDIDIKEILSYLICFDVETYDSNKHPISAYSSKASAVDHFKKHRERMIKFLPLLPEILKLHDEIYMKLPAAYNELGGKFGSLTGVVEVSGRRIKKTVLSFTGRESSYRIPNGFIYPILAAFRPLIKCSPEKCSWKEDPIKFFESIEVDLANRVGVQARELRNPNKLGKDTATWRMCYDRVEAEILRRNL